MANETEVIREKMEATRTDLSDKIEQLEKSVVDTVQEATSTVAEAVQGAKDVVESVKDTMEGAMGTVKDTVESVQGTMENVTGAVGDAVENVKEGFVGAAEAVRDTFDLPRQVDRHPWLMMGGAVAVGFTAGKLLGHAPRVARYVGRAAETGGRMAGSALSAAGSAASTAGSWLGSLEAHVRPRTRPGQGTGPRDAARRGPRCGGAGRPRIDVSSDTGDHRQRYVQDRRQARRRPRPRAAPVRGGDGGRAEPPLLSGARQSRDREGAEEAPKLPPLPHGRGSVR